MFRALNILAENHENKYHQPILKQITDYLKINHKIIHYSKCDLIMSTEYKFYNENNYLIFKLKMQSTYNIPTIIIIDLEFTYSKNVLYYWTQLFNPKLSITWNNYENNEVTIIWKHNKNIENIENIENNENNLLKIKNFIEENMFKNNLQ